MAIGSILGSVRRLAVSSLALATGCFFAPLDLSDRVCATTDDCAAGYVCAAERCVLEAPIDTCDPACTVYEECRDGACVIPPFDAAAWGAPDSVYRLMVSGTFYLDGLPASVDPETLDRILVPAGHYTECSFVHLPERPPERPLVITNVGGQVVCDSLSIWGGRGIVVTGRSDSAAGTGDPGFPGHAAGFAGSAGRYGIHVTRVLSVSDREEQLTGDVELDYIEVGGAAEPGDDFTVRLTTHAPGRGIHVHDSYFHDLFGPVRVELGDGPHDAAIHDVRITRADHGCLLVTSQGPTVVAQSSFVACTAGWRRNAEYSRDAALELAPRGDVGIRFERNAVLGAHGPLVLVRSDNPATARPFALLRDNVLSDAGAAYVYWGDDAVSTLTARTDGNRYVGRHFDWSGIVGAPLEPTSVHYVDSTATMVRFVLRGDRWDAPGVTAPLPTTYPFANVDAMDCMAADLTEPSVGSFGTTGVFGTVETWTADALLRRTSEPRYPAGARVWWNGGLWTATADVETGAEPGLDARWSGPVLWDEDYTLTDPEYADVGARSP